jgi:hypothetical protein
MTKKAHIVINLLPETSNASDIQLQEKIKNEAKIPLCKEIEKVTIEDVEDSYISLKKQGISQKVARNLMDLYTE